MDHRRKWFSELVITGELVMTGDNQSKFLFQFFYRLGEMSVGWVELKISYRLRKMSLGGVKLKKKII